MKITRHGAPQQTNGEPPMIGHNLPAFTVKAADGHTVSDRDLAGHYSLISVVPDIDTRVCSVSTKNFNQAADGFADINFFTISTNTIAQQQNWCAAEGVKQMQMLSDEAGSFGQAMGLYVADNNTNARSVWITNPEGKIVYRELIEEQTEEPDYDSALAYLETHAK
ncbi:thiol peroxidase [Lacticaseibacillus suilingensis]|uniref:thiol peroxidase n=1 Tax=Lacticaseibacillus suilingensis TaxID=2799577 RepID=UPI0022DEDA47|nr:thiol peroxidase [Lacticaseibacillus suilingensis]